MDPQKKIEIASVLENSRADVNAAISGVAEMQASASPEADRWSILECVEHIATVEERFLGRLEEAEKHEASSPDYEKEAELFERVTSRATRAVAPEAARPKGRFQSLSGAVEHFNAVRGRTLEFAEKHCDELYSLSIEHPRFGRLNGAEVLIVMAGHAQRHADQIREITLSNR